MQTMFAKLHSENTNVRFFSVMTRSDIEAMSEAITETGCWVWLGSVTQFGHGVCRGGAAHRVSYELHKGEIPKGMYICHRCNVASCVNPNHLYAGTAIDNSNDRQNRHCKITRRIFSPEMEAKIAIDRRHPRAIAKSLGVGVGAVTYTQHRHGTRRGETRLKTLNDFSVGDRLINPPTREKMVLLGPSERGRGYRWIKVEATGEVREVGSGMSAKPIEVV